MTSQASFGTFADVEARPPTRRTAATERPAPDLSGRDRCHRQLVSSGNGAVSPRPATVELHGARSRRHQTEARNR